MMVASKFLYDDGEDEGVYNDEWAESAGDHCIIDEYTLLKKATPLVAL
jgi:hypothetical protein